MNQMYKDIMIKNKSKVFIIITGIAVIVLGLYVHSHNSAHTRYMDAQYAADFSDDKILVGASHNIFVGKVIEQIGTKEQDIGPETQFSVEVIENIKGNLKDVVMVDQEGGFKNGILYVMADEGSSDKKTSYLLKPGSTYLFATRYNKEENWYTLNSYPTARKFISSNTTNTEELKTLAINDSRFQELQKAYKNEILLDIDVKNNNTLNSYKSLQEEKSISQ